MIIMQRTTVIKCRRLTDASKTFIEDTLVTIF